MITLNVTRKEDFIWKTHFGKIHKGFDPPLILLAFLGLKFCFINSKIKNSFIFRYDSLQIDV